ncbi:MAG: hypothetical protein HQL17_03315 [Candidatus Omnitrophica bacterium]|nr:hypothetical protein [Candidatus Omnitrophota bacterium]
MADHPLGSRSSVYFERYGMAERQSMSLGMTVYLLGGVCGILAVGLVLVAVRPKAIYYIPAVAAAGVAYPDQVPPSSALSFAESWLMDWVNYTPETVAGVYERTSKFMSPGLLARVRAGMDQELARIARSQASSSFYLKASGKVRDVARGFEVTLAGVRAVYAGKEELSREEVIFEVRLSRATVTVQNPYGLVIEDVLKKRGDHEDR